MKTPRTETVTLDASWVGRMFASERRAPSHARTPRQVAEELGVKIHLARRLLLEGYQAGRLNRARADGQEMGYWPVEEEK